LVFFILHSLIHNFYEAGFETIVAGSFISDRGGYDRFRKLLTVNPNIIVVMLTANKSTRDERIITREKSVTVTISLTVSGGKIVTVTLFPEYSSDIAPEFWHDQMVSLCRQTIGVIAHKLSNALERCRAPVLAPMGYL
jgi:hypothetical protein